MRLVQQHGFNGFSYADIAEEVGIRKASLHHHFPSKIDLGLALIDTYSKQIEDGLLSLDAALIPADKKLAAYIDFYRSALKADRMCLGGMLASDILTLDAAMLPALKRFFARNIKWLSAVLSEGESQQLFTLSGTAISHAHVLLSALQGALLLARATGDRKGFDQAASLLISTLLRKG